MCIRDSGYTMQVETGDKYLMTKKELENKIATFTGGRAAEEIVFGEITTGASNDIEQDVYKRQGSSGTGGRKQVDWNYFSCDRAEAGD